MEVRLVYGMSLVFSAARLCSVKGQCYNDMLGLLLRKKFHVLLGNSSIL